MDIKKLLSLLLAVILSCSIIGGCSSTESYVLYLELNEQPDTLDPQLVNGNSEEIIVKNLFEGLMREDSDGNIVCGAAESYTLSPDKLTYTFKIRDDAKWSNGDALTAEEFVFGFTRAVDPKNLAPYASILYNIQGAEEINTGKQGGVLAVTAIDTKTLKIQLKTPDSKFLETLTAAVCMPCHKTTYEKAKGQYGKTGDHIISNGSFRLRFWNKEETFSLRLNKNEEYTGAFKSEANAVIFSVGELSGRAARIDEANLDLGFINNSEATGKSNIYTFEKTCYALVINKSSAFGSDDFRKAFALSINRERLKTELGKSLTETNSLIPTSVLLNDKPISSQISAVSPPSYSPDIAYNLYIKAAKEAKDLPSAAEIIYCGNDEVTDMAKLIAENFQQTLGAVVNLKAMDSENELYSAMNSGSYQLAIVPLTAQSDDPKLFFDEFISITNGKNIYGFYDAAYDAEVNRITTTADTATVIDASTKASNLLINDISVIPLCLYTEAFSYGKDFTVPVVSPYNGIVDLALIRKIS